MGIHDFSFDFFEQDGQFAQGGSGLYHAGCGIGPRGLCDAECALQLGRGLRQERLHEHRAVGSDLDACIEDDRCPLGVGLIGLPRFLLGHVLVAQARNAHGGLQGVSEAVASDEPCDLRRGRRQRVKHVAVGLVQVGFADGRYGTFVVLAGQHQHAVHEVAEHVGQLVVDPVAVIGPGEFAVLLLGHDARENVAQLVAFPGELAEELIDPHCPIARGGNFVAFQVHEGVGWNV